MTEFTSNPIHEYSNGLLDNPEFQSIYESFLTAQASGDLLTSCPVLGIQTQAESTSKTGSLRDDGVSSLPLACRLDIDVGLWSPLETTVLDSSSPLDGIPLSFLLHSFVELTSASLPTQYQFYCGSIALVVETDEQSLQVCVQVQSDSTRININNSRLLKLSPPIPGDTVRVIRGGSAGTIGTITSQHDNTQVLVKMDGHTSPFPLQSCDLVRLDSSSLQDNMSTTHTASLPPTIEGDDTDDSNGYSQTNKSSPSFSSNWRVNSPVPLSPMDSLGTTNNFNPSPSSSLIGNVTSPGNPWSVSSSSSIPEYAYGLSSDSSASSSNCPTAVNNTNNKQQQQQQQQQTVQSLPTPSTNNELQGNHFIRHEDYQNTSQSYTSLPSNNQYDHYAPLKQQPSPTYAYPLGDSAHHKPISPPSSNLYPVITGDTVFTPQANMEQPNTNTTTNTNGYSNVSYPTLPSYAAVTNPVQFSQQPWSNIAMVNCSPQQPQYTPVLLSNNSYATLYGYQQIQPQQYQSAAMTTNGTHPQIYSDQLTQNGTSGSNLYPQLCPASQMTMPPNQRSYLHQPYTTNQVSSTCKTGLVNRFKNLQTGSRKKSSLYPQLPSNAKLMEPKETPWDEFKSLINSIQRRTSCKPLSLESVINTAIEGLSTKTPPQHWYNPLAAMEDDECESDLSTESVRVSALCPLIKQRMEYPCRGLHCKHLQCFDAKAFLRLALKRRSQLVSNLRGSSHSSSHPDNGWKCPMCGKIVSVNQLYIERYLQKAINEFSDVTELEFKTIDGGTVWAPYQKCHEPSNSVIDLTMDSDTD